MRKNLETQLFPFVEKPARYIGQEMGIIRKNPEGRVNIALAYPDLYELGVSYNGGQILYHLINGRDDALCERVYAPWTDADAIMREKDIPLFTLESHRAVRDFDVFGFTLAYEMVYTNLLNMLELAGIPLLARDRSDSDPLIVAGGPICFNPEPMADFIDFFFIGEAEEALGELLTIIGSTRGEPREKRLMKLARVESVYVPSLYDSKTLKPLHDSVPEKIVARHTSSLRPEYYPSQPILPLAEITHDRVSVEIMRGCPQGCRFCQAGKIYKPVRTRSVSDIKKQVMDNLTATGYDEVGLLSLSTTDYPEIAHLSSSLATALEPQKVALSLPSLRPASFTAGVADAVKRSHKTGLTFAPEVGTDRMRQVVGKKITEGELLEAVRTAYEKGWQLIKLYFMIGLPTETDEDIEGIIDLIDKSVRIARGIRGQHKINVTISPFSPKAHTAFQWDRLNPPEEIRRKQEMLKNGVRAREVTLKFRNPQLSYLEGIIGRGDRNLGQVILAAFRNGARFDGWSEYFDFQKWEKAFADCDLEMGRYSREFSFSERLPWDHIDRGQSKERLAQERSRSAELAHGDISMAEESEPAAPVANDNDMYGRRKKRVAASAANVPPTRGKIRIRWGKKGLVRFTSHLDNNRVFERAIRRAELPVAYSQGFHPHQKLSFGPPLPLGYSSNCEYMDIQVEGSCTREQVERLGPTLPEGYYIGDFKLIYSKAPAISAMLNRAVYEVFDIADEPDLLRDKIEAILARDSVIVMRSGKDGGKEVDIRPAIYRFEVIEGDSGLHIEMELGLGSDGYAKPSEAMESLGIYAQGQITALHFHRKALQYRDQNGAYLDPLTAIV